MASLEEVPAVAGDMEKATTNDYPSARYKEETVMTHFRRALSAVVIACAMSIGSLPAYSQAKGHGKAKRKPNLETKEKHGRDAGELPVGLKTYMEKKGEGELPSGLQNKKDEDGYLTHGLEDRGKRSKSLGKGKTSPRS